jgi:hypothetical protein
VRHTLPRNNFHTLPRHTFKDDPIGQEIAVAKERLGCGRKTGDIGTLPLADCRKSSWSATVSRS